MVHYTLFILLEKILPLGNLGGRLAGGVAICCGVIILALRLIPQKKRPPRGEAA